MIKYAIACDQGHVFDVWFANAAAATEQIAAGDVVCPSCGASSVRKALMAPRIATGRAAPEPTATVPSASAPSAQKAGGEAPSAQAPAVPPGAAAQALARRRAALEKLWALREAVEKSAEHVGQDFAAEARRIHEGDAPERPIWGECAPDDAIDLLEDGAPVAPLPPKRPADA